ncbi:MAG: pilin [bacterium]
MKNIWKNLLCLVILSVFMVPALVMTSPAQAQNELDLWGDPLTNEGFAAEKLNDIGLGKKDPREIASNIIQILLGLLGIIAVVIILIGGFKWMTASGNEDQVATAKKLLGAGVIGLLIVLAAWALAMFIISRFLYSTGGEGWNNPIYNS